MTPPLTEDTLVQQTTADYLQDELGWESVFAFNTETFGPDGTLGRVNATQVVLTRYLKAKLEQFNPGLPLSSYSEAEVDDKTSSIFQHIFRAYPYLPSPFYSQSITKPNL